MTFFRIAVNITNRIILKDALLFIPSLNKLPQISNTINDSALKDFGNVNFHEIPSLGYFPK